MTIDTPLEGGFVAGCDLAGAVRDITIGHVCQVGRDVGTRGVAKGISFQKNGSFVAVLIEAGSVVDRDTSTS